jgi:NADH:ubiquinone oxidoreductase subunit E
MGASHLQTLEEHLPDDVREHVEIRGAHCLGLCKERNYGKAPFVKVDEHVVAAATIPEVVAAVVAAVRGKTT